MSEDLKLSTVEEMAAAEATKLIALPMAKVNGKPAVVQIKAVPALKLLAIMEGAPQDGDESPQREFTLAEIRALLEGSERLNRETARLGLKSPAFAFDQPEEGKANWSDLPSVDQSFIAREITRFSGLGGNQEDAAVGSFPAGQREGRDDGGRAGGDGSPADGAGA